MAMVATVIQPILGMFGERFEVAPYGVILKPAHGLKILREERRAGFSPKAAYIFRKQLEEADFVIINRIDQLAAEQRPQRHHRQHREPQRRLQSWLGQARGYRSQPAGGALASGSIVYVGTTGIPRELCGSRSGQLAGPVR